MEVGRHGKLTFKDLTVTCDVTSGLFNDSCEAKSHGLARQCALDWSAWEKETYLAGLWGAIRHPQEVC